MVGCRWQDCPKEYGPHKNIYNRVSRCSEKDVWQKNLSRRVPSRAMV